MAGDQAIPVRGDHFFKSVHDVGKIGVGHPPERTVSSGIQVKMIFCFGGRITWNPAAGVLCCKRNSSLP